MMSRLMQLSFSTLFLFTACNSREPEVTIRQDESKMQDSAVSMIVDRFNLPYSDVFSLDSNSIIFYGSRTFDTSFLVHFRKYDNIIKGTYFEVLPDYHKSLTDLRISDNQILFFEGYGFILDTIDWNKIIGKVKELPPNDTSEKANPSVLGGDYYVLCYNNGVNKSNPYSLNKYGLFYGFLRDTLFTDIIKRRKPTMHKST